MVTLKHCPACGKELPFSSIMWKAQWWIHCPTCSAKLVYSTRAPLVIVFTGLAIAEAGFILPSWLVGPVIERIGGLLFVLLLGPGTCWLCWLMLPFVCRLEVYGPVPPPYDDRRRLQAKVWHANCPICESDLGLNDLFLQKGLELRCPGCRSVARFVYSAGIPFLVTLAVVAVLCVILEYIPVLLAARRILISMELYNTILLTIFASFGPIMWLVLIHLRSIVDIKRGVSSTCASNE